MTTERLEQDPVAQPLFRRCLETDLTRLVGVWGPAEGLVSGVPDEEVRGLAFLSSKPWLVIARLSRERSGPGDALRAVAVPSGFEVPIPYFPDDVERRGLQRLVMDYPPRPDRLRLRCATLESFRGSASSSRRTRFPGRRPTSYSSVNRTDFS